MRDAASAVAWSSWVVVLALMRGFDARASKDDSRVLPRIDSAYVFPVISPIVRVARLRAACAVMRRLLADAAHVGVRDARLEAGLAAAEEYCASFPDPAAGPSYEEVQAHRRALVDLEASSPSGSPTRLLVAAVYELVQMTDSIEMDNPGLRSESLLEMLIAIAMSLGDSEMEAKRRVREQYAAAGGDVEAIKGG